MIVPSNGCFSRVSDGVMGMADLEFRLDVIETGDSWTIVCDCPQGRRVAHVPVPFSADQLRNHLNDIEMSLVRSTAPLITRRAARPEHMFGRELIKILLADDIRVLFALCREKAREQGDRMRVLMNPIGPNVCRIPWEFVTDPDAEDEYLALRVAMARSPHLMEPVSPLRITPPLRILGVLSRPQDLPQLEADLERKQITSALKQLSSDFIHMEWLDSDRWQLLRSRLQSEPWHILHFIGHGGFDDDLQSGYLELTDEEGDALRVQASDIASFIRGNPQLKLVVLNACESAATGDDGVFSSTAAKLMRAGVPAVVAMQYEITDPAALAFSYSFYEAIARGMPVDRAVTHAREEVKITTGSLEWATPVLFLGSSETQIFELPAPRPQVELPTAPTPAPAPTAAARPAEEPVTAARADRENPDWTGHVRSRLTQILDKVAEKPPQVRGRGATGEPAPAASTSRRDANPPALSIPRRTADIGLSLRWASPAYGSCTHARLGPEGLVALACPDGLRVISLTRRREAARCSLPRADPPVKVVWSPWPRNVASLDGRGAIVIWDLGSEAPLHVLRPQGRGIAVQVAFSHNGKWLAVACNDLTVHVFNSGGAEVRMFQVASLAIDNQNWPPPLRVPTTLAFTPDDRQLIVGADDGTLRQYDVHGRLVRTWRHTHSVAGFAATGTMIVTSCGDGRVRTWTWDGTVIRRMDARATEHVGMSPDGQTIAVIADTTCTAWNRAGGLLGSATVAAKGTGLGFSPVDGLITVAATGVIESWAGVPGGEVSA
jgi:hypothetical protein